MKYDVVSVKDRARYVEMVWIYREDERTAIDKTSLQDECARDSWKGSTSANVAQSLLRTFLEKASLGVP